jgi:homoserine dehydrogenase
LIEAAGLYVSSVILIEVVQLIVDVDGRLYTFLYLYGNSAGGANTASRIVIVPLSNFFDLIAHNIEGNT